MHDSLVSGATSAKTSSPLKQAAVRGSRSSREGMLERLFALVFDGLVYPQIWEDPVVDMAAMEIEPNHHIVAITSGGCNIMSYLTANPARITAVDLNVAHLSLLELKLKAAAHFRSHEDFYRFFGQADSKLNPQLFDLLIAPHLSVEARAYWDTASRLRNRRIEMFAKGFYRYGLLGRFITASHIVARLFGINPAELAAAKTIEEQRAFFKTKLEPLFQRCLVRALTSSPMSLYGLGIPPAQYAELAGGRHMADVLCERLEALSCNHALRENYFARQAFGRCYGPAASDAALPPYLDKANWKTLQATVGRVRMANSQITDVLAAHPEASVDRVVLLDAQDWMDRRQINDLWAAITRVAKPGARVIFRTAAYTSPLEEKLDAGVLSRWVHDGETSLTLGKQDRSAIYGGFHIYRLKP
jgi:S-adenosylmethionine-diacylglycerol 3-amino-3-carboxypropyl transferase